MSAGGLKTKPQGLVDKNTVHFSRAGGEGWGEGGGRGQDSRSIVAECCKAISGVTGAYTNLVS